MRRKPIGVRAAANLLHTPIVLALTIGDRPSMGHLGATKCNVRHRWSGARFYPKHGFDDGTGGQPPRLQAPLSRPFSMRAKALVFRFDTPIELPYIPMTKQYVMAGRSRRLSLAGHF
jgi:hypothetical protein